MAVKLTREAHFFTLFLSEISPFFNLFLSHPLYLCFFVILFPYLLKPISFLCPLFFTACLVYYVTVLSTIAKLNSGESHWTKELLLAIDDLSVCEMFLFGSTAEAMVMQEASPEAIAQMKNAEISGTGSLHESSPSDAADETSSTSQKKVAGAASSDLLDQCEKNSNKEWKRTLACKLFEERHGGEGMDLLWEEAECGFPATSTKRDQIDADADDEEEEFAGGEGGGEVCCMQALKLSAGKMRLGMGGRRKLAKITKAIKGLGMLRVLHVRKKKVHNNGDKLS